ncbi:MAG: coproporphyrinogen dehydrogenase HemZ [Oscillospiraceae bacterium]|nr:coproporphyrinogen dehydrogenase HemZ [Oscillospiraceae bacterium]
MITLEISRRGFGYEAECVARLFYPGERIQIVELHREDLYVRVFGKEASQHPPAETPEPEQERLMCGMLYKLLCEATGKTPPWGMLTGIRPVRLVHPLLEQGMTDSGIARFLEQNYFTSPEKAELAIQTAKAEQAILAGNSTDAASLYVGIPFCPTRCLYCSFVSHAAAGAGKLIPEYVRLLCEELRVTAQVLQGRGLKLQTVYIGGGTPTVLSPPQLAQVMAAIRGHFDLSNLLEYTVEAGRADTVTPEILGVIREHGADRLSVNPQTMDDEVLSRIGRAHTVRQAVEAFHMASGMGFAVINMDLIAGLPGESPEGFLRGLDEIIRLSPGNITVHTLTVKRSSELRGREDAFEDDGVDFSPALTQARGSLGKAGYAPYYLYRQKATRGNLENTGYSKKGMECRYNIYMMGDNHTVMAAGAGGVTKICAGENRIERIFNYKYPYEYIARFDEIISRKEKAGKLL